MSSVDRPHPGWWISIGAGMTLTGLLALHPGAYAAWASHVTALLPRGLIQGIFVVAVALHVGEGLYALRLARAHGEADAAGWFWQTLALGYPSLGLLRRRVAAGAASSPVAPATS